MTHFVLGFCTKTQGAAIIGEIKDSMWDGKVTVYPSDEGIPISNDFMVKGMFKRSELLRVPEKAFYGTGRFGNK